LVKRIRLVLLITFALLAATTFALLAITTTSAFTPTSGRPYAASSAWNTPIPANPVIDPANPATMAYLSSGTSPAVANLYSHGVPIWDADATTPRYPVNCVRPWGVCALERQPVPIPTNAFAARGSDAAMVIIDWSTGKSFDFWKATKASGVWQAGWGGVHSTSTDGIGTPDNHGVGAGVSRLAGVVRIHEMEAGHINHALVFSTNNACKSVYRYPASKTDGVSSRTDCIPEGARIQLDPAINVDAIPHITPGERTIAKALQTYGAYNIDNGGANMAFIFETPSGEADPYPSLGITWDYFALDRIPATELRVLRTWDGS
jgi:hypothetical protein